MNYKILKNLLILVLLQSGGWAQEDSLHFPQIAVDQALQRYGQSLQHSNEGVVASAIFKVLKLKMWYPREDFTQPRAQLERLMAEGRTPAIRLKAFVAASYLSHPEWFNWIGRRSRRMPMCFSRCSRNGWISSYTISGSAESKWKGLIRLLCHGLHG